MKTTELEYVKQLFSADAKLKEAAIEFIERQNRISHPDGSNDKGGRWYPSDGERQLCCQSVRSPSRGYPWSYMVHCRTAKHIATLYGVDERSLKRLATYLKSTQEKEVLK